MQREEALEKIREAVVSVLNIDGDKVIETATFADDLGADSLDTVELVMALEESFDVAVPDDKIETIKTVGDALDFFLNA